MTVVALCASGLRTELRLLYDSDAAFSFAEKPSDDRSGSDTAPMKFLHQSIRFLRGDSDQKSA